MAPPTGIKLYHITHVANLPAIIRDDGLWSDAAMLARGGPATSIGLGEIKQRRLRLPVRCHPGDHVGDYVPFYFCPRSVMLYVIHKANHAGLSYRDGQDEIVHLVADMQQVVDWAEAQDRRWAFTSANAGTLYCDFFNRLSDLSVIDWQALRARDWRDPAVKDAKQAEFLVHKNFAWPLVESIGVHSRRVMARVNEALRTAAHVPKVEINRDWYY